MKEFDTIYMYITENDICYFVVVLIYRLQMLIRLSTKVTRDKRMFKQIKVSTSQ